MPGEASGPSTSCPGGNLEAGHASGPVTPDGLSMFDAHDSRQRMSTRFFVYEAFLNRKRGIH